MMKYHQTDLVRERSDQCVWKQGMCVLPESNAACICLNIRLLVSNSCVNEAADGLLPR